MEQTIFCATSVCTTSDDSEFPLYQMWETMLDLQYYDVGWHKYSQNRSKSQGLPFGSLNDLKSFSNGSVR